MRSKGFTLIELLVVISIIAILLAIIMPALNIVKEKAAGVVCLANLSNLGKAWYAYCSENDQKMVNGNTGYSSEHWVNAPLVDTGVDVSNASNHVSFKDSTVEQKINGIKKGALFSYLKTPKVYHCRGDRRSKTNPKAGGSGKGGYRTYSVPGGMNGLSRSHTGEKLKKITELRSPDSRYAFLEEADGRGGNGGVWQIYKNRQQWIDPVAIWHNNSSTYAYADGHAEDHKWHGEETIEMAEKQTFLYIPETSAGIEDFLFAQKGYAHVENP